MTNLGISSRQAYNGMLRNVNDFTIEELLKSQGFKDVLSQVNVSNLKPNEVIYLDIYSADNDDTGCTNNEWIKINTTSPLVLGVQDIYDYLQQDPSDIEEWAKQLPEITDVKTGMYLANIGTISHEDGHVLYTNFAEYNKILNKVNIGDFSKCTNNDKLKRIYSSKMGNVLVSCCNDMGNIVEDGYIEYCLVLYYPDTGTVVKGLIVCNAVKFFLSGNCDEVEEKIANGEYPLAYYFLWLLQLIILGYTPKHWERCKGLVHDTIVEALDKARPIVDDYVKGNKNHEKDYWQLVDIMSTLFPDPNELPQENKQSQNGENSDSNQSNNDEGKNQSNSTGNGNQSQQNSSSQQNKSREQQKQDLINGQNFDDQNGEQLMNDAGISKQPVGTGYAKRQPKNDKDSQEQAETAKENAKKNTTGKEFDNLSKMIAKAMADDQVQQDQCKELSKSFKSKEFEGSFVTIGKTKQIKPDERDKSEYKKIYNSVKTISDNCVRKVSQILEKRDYDDEESGYVIGTKFNANQAYRYDRAMFSKKIDPDETPDVCFSIMVDQSGSMHGSNIEAAKKVTILFTDVAEKLNIPVQVIGHTTNYDLETYDYVNFDSRPSEKYSLSSMSACGANVDSIVLSGICENIMKRPEKRKVVIVISDGLPNYAFEKVQTNFKGLPIQYSKYNGYNVKAKAHLNTVVRYYRKKGVKIIGVSLDDYENIRSIYEEGTIDCSNANLKNLPNELLKIFKRYVLRQ